MTVEQFNHNFENNVNAIHNFALKLTSNMADADDLVQETAMKAFRAMHTFKPSSNFKSWTFTILKNTFYTQYRRRSRMRTVRASVEDFAITSEYATRNDAISQLKLKEIQGCISQLSDKCSEPFSLYLKGYQYNEIAEQLDIPIGTVKSRLNYARTKLKSLLLEKGIEV